MFIALVLVIEETDRCAPHTSRVCVYVYIDIHRAVFSVNAHPNSICLCSLNNTLFYRYCVYVLIAFIHGQIQQNQISKFIISFFFY